KRPVTDGYLDGLRRRPRLTRDEERSLVQQVGRGDREAAGKLVVGLSARTGEIALELRPTWMPEGTALGEANTVMMGLVLEGKQVSPRLRRAIRAHFDQLPEESD